MPTVAMQPYANFLAKVLNKEIDLDSDSIRLTLHTSTYTPNRSTDAYFSAATNELATAGGYTAAGATLTTPVVSVTAANSWGRSAAVSTAYVVNDLVRPATGNGFVYRCVVAGTSGGSAPTWPTVIGQTVTDGSVTWSCVGSNVVKFTSDPVTYSAPFSAGPFRNVVLHDHTPATDATRPLIAVATYAADQTGGDGSATFTPDTYNGWLAIPIP